MHSFPRLFFRCIRKMTRSCHEEDLHTHAHQKESEREKLSRGFDPIASPALLFEMFLLLQDGTSYVTRSMLQRAGDWTRWWVVRLSLLAGPGISFSSMFVPLSHLCVCSQKRAKTTMIGGQWISHVKREDDVSLISYNQLQFWRPNCGEGRKNEQGQGESLYQFTSPRTEREGGREGKTSTFACQLSIGLSHFPHSLRFLKYTLPLFPFSSVISHCSLHSLHSSIPFL